MKTYSPKPQDVQRNWHVIDAQDRILGRMATEIAVKLRGKDKPEFAPHMDMGDFVIVVNADKFSFTQKQLDDKLYHRHSGYPGGLRTQTLRDMLQKHPDRVIRKAVWGMLPHNRLGRKLLKRLKVYAGNEHPHEAQKPQLLA